MRSKDLLVNLSVKQQPTSWFISFADKHFMRGGETAGVNKSLTKVIFLTHRLCKEAFLATSLGEKENLIWVAAGMCQRGMLWHPMRNEPVMILDAEQLSSY